MIFKAKFMHFIAGEKLKIFLVAKILRLLLFERSFLLAKKIMRLPPVPRKLKTLINAS